VYFRDENGIVTIFSLKYRTLANANSERV